jgi:mRNA-degrading endonuclease RelE of RelBE toxin-antitoxin system
VAYKLSISDEAALDAADAIAYYESMQTGLKHRFLSKLSDAYYKISTQPEQYSFISSKKKNKYRDIKLKSFPYNVIFEINGDTIEILSVFNTHRNPKYK